MNCMAHITGILLLFSSNGVLSATSPIRERSNYERRAYAVVQPVDGSVVAVNPPSFIWPGQSDSSNYFVELSRSSTFTPLHASFGNLTTNYLNVEEALDPATWYWRVRGEGHGEYGPVRSFTIPPSAIRFPYPGTEELLNALAPHPRILRNAAEFASLRTNHELRETIAYKELLHEAEELLENPWELLPNDSHVEDRWPSLEALKKSAPEGRRRVFFLNEDGSVLLIDQARGRGIINRLGSEAVKLALAGQLTGDENYSRAAAGRLATLAPYRVDLHLDWRASHDTVVYFYEHGLKDAAVAYDWSFYHLRAQDKAAIQDHIIYHGEAAYEWLRDIVNIEKNFLSSHPQQAMSQLTITALSLGNDRSESHDWLEMLLPQYYNRLPWLNDDGGYFEGQTYGHKLQWIQEVAQSIRSATGMNLFQMPAMSNTARFWVYCMSLNSWYAHNGDIYSLLWSQPSPRDAVIANTFAHVYNSPELAWWSENTFANPRTSIFEVLNNPLPTPKPPFQWPYSGGFIGTGQTAAYSQLHDLGATAVYFRSSPWGAHSHAHADQNSFVIHSHGDILAADTGYYSYYGDTHHKQFTRATISHNSILIDGKGQIDGGEGKGRIAAFLDTPMLSISVGDASQSYETPLERFSRFLIYDRSGGLIVGDLLRAEEPFTSTWLFNNLTEFEWDGPTQTILSEGLHSRLEMNLVLPGDLDGKVTQADVLSLKSKRFSRVTSAFPIPWRMEFSPAGPSTGQNYLAVGNISNQTDDPSWQTIDASVEGESFSAKLRNEDGETMNLKFGYNPGETEPYAIIEKRGKADRLRAVVWLNTDGYGTPSIEIKTQGSRGGFVEFTDDGSVSRLGIDPTGETAPVVSIDGRHMASEYWKAGSVSADKGTFGPVSSWLYYFPEDRIPERPSPIVVSAVGPDGKIHDLDLEGCLNSYGERIWHGTVQGLPEGEYTVESGRQGHWLVQYPTHPEFNLRGALPDRIMLKKGTELFLRYTEDTMPSPIKITYADTLPLPRLSMFRNGEFTEGNVGYPPRYWVIEHPRNFEDGSFPGWKPDEGGILSFTHDRDWMVVLSPPVMIPQKGDYRLAWRTQGKSNVSRIDVLLEGDAVKTFPVGASAEWTENSGVVQLDPGLVQVQVRMLPTQQEDGSIDYDYIRLLPISSAKSDRH